MATKSEYLTLRIKKADKQRLIAIARKERRTLSQVAGLMLEYAITMKVAIDGQSQSEGKEN